MIVLKVIFRYATSILALFSLLMLPALAHGPSPQKAEVRAVIASPPDAVWKIAGDFAGIGTWHPRVKDVTASGGNSPGAERVLQLEKGEITDGLDSYDAEARSLAWRLNKENVEAFPVSFYTITLTVSDAGSGTSEVVFAARFYRGDTGNYPPDELTDEAATAAITDFFEAGIEGLKAKTEVK